MTWIDYMESFQLSSAEIALRMHNYSAGFYACMRALLHSMYVAVCDEWEDKFFLIKLKRCSLTIATSQLKYAFSLSCLSAQYKCGWV